MEPVVGPSPPAVDASHSTAVVSPALVSPLASAPRFNLSEMPRHHAVNPNTSSYQVVPGDPNVHPALRADAAKGVMAAVARAVERKERKDKERGKGDRDKEGERKDRREDRKHRKKRKSKPHSEAVEAESSGTQKSGPKEISERSSKRKEKENELSGKSHRSTSQRQQTHENLQGPLGSEALADPTSQPAVQASIVPEKPRHHKHRRRKVKDTASSSTKPAEQPTQQAQQATKQTHTQETTTPASEMPGPSPPTSCPPDSMPKPFPIHILLRRITTSKDLSPRQKSSLLTTLHGSLVDLAIRTSLELQLTERYAKIAAEAAAVQTLVSEIEDPTPNKPVSLENLKASGALGGYLFGVPGLRQRSGSNSSSIYSQDGADKAWEDFIDEERKGEDESAGTGCHNALSDEMLDAERSQLEGAVKSLKITKNSTSNKLDVYCG